MPTFKHTVLYCLFDSNWDKTNIMLEKNEDMLSLTGIMETGKKVLCITKVYVTAFNVCVFNKIHEIKKIVSSYLSSFPALLHSSIFSLWEEKTLMWMDYKHERGGVNISARIKEWTDGTSNSIKQLQYFQKACSAIERALIIMRKIFQERESQLINYSFLRCQRNTFAYRLLMHRPYREAVQSMP